MPDTLSVTLSALADPTRRAILARLARGEATVNDIAKPFDISLPAVSRHLKVLEGASLSGGPVGWSPGRSRPSTTGCRAIAASGPKASTRWTHISRSLKPRRSASECQTGRRRAPHHAHLRCTGRAGLCALVQAGTYEALDGPGEFHLPRGRDRLPRRRYLPRDDHVAGAWRELVRRRLSRDRREQAARFHLHLGQ